MRTTFRMTLLCFVFSGSTHGQTLDQLLTFPTRDYPLSIRLNDLPFVYALSLENDEPFWEIPLESSDAGTVFILDETTAASYGANWDAIHRSFETIGPATVHLQAINVYGTRDEIMGLNLTPLTDLHRISLSFDALPGSAVRPDILIIAPVVTFHLTSQVPEPATLLMCVSSVAGLAVMRQQRSR